MILELLGDTKGESCQWKGYRFYDRDIKDACREKEAESDGKE